jgi:hypothetical protein
MTIIINWEWGEKFAPNFFLNFHFLRAERNHRNSIPIFEIKNLTWFKISKEILNHAYDFVNFCDKKFLQFSYTNLPKMSRNFLIKIFKKI